MTRLLINDFNIEQDINNFDSMLLIIQNKKKLLQVLNDISNECNELEFIKIIDEKGKILKLEDYIDSTISLFNIDINNKKNLNALFRQIKKANYDYIYDSINQITNNLQNLFNNINLESSLELINDLNISEDDILKLLKIQINDKSNELLIKIMNYIKVGFELRKVYKYLFFNLSSLLSFEEIALLIHDCKLIGIQIINIEYLDVNKGPFDTKKVLDEDICLIE